MRYGYASPTQKDPDCHVQILRLKNEACQVIFTESSANFRLRQELQKLISTLKTNDVLVLTTLTSLEATLGRILTTIGQVSAIGADIILLDDGIATSRDDHQGLFFHAKLFAGCELSLGIERMLEGRASAKSKGLKLGRKPKLNADQIEHGRKLLGLGETGRAVARTLGISEATLYRHVKHE